MFLTELLMLCSHFSIPLLQNLVDANKKTKYFKSSYLPRIKKCEFALNSSIEVFLNLNCHIPSITHINIQVILESFQKCSRNKGDIGVWRELRDFDLRERKSINYRETHCRGKNECRQHAIGYRGNLRSLCRQVCGAHKLVSWIIRKHQRFSIPVVLLRAGNHFSYFTLYPLVFVTSDDNNT